MFVIYYKVLSKYKMIPPSQIYLKAVFLFYCIFVFFKLLSFKFFILQ